MYKSFEDMPVWNKAFELADEIYDLTEKFPKTELYALTDQLKRSSVSISANIAESFGRYHALDKVNFFYNARGSAHETKSHLLFALRRRYINEGEYEKLKMDIDNIFEGINNLISSFRNKQLKKP